MSLGILGDSAPARIFHPFLMEFKSLLAYESFVDIKAILVFLISLHAENKTSRLLSSELDMLGQLQLDQI